MKRSMAYPNGRRIFTGLCWSPGAAVPGRDSLHDSVLFRDLIITSPWTKKRRLYMKKIYLAISIVENLIRITDETRETEPGHDL